jgi:hypothetical protein
MITYNYKIIMGMLMIASKVYGMNNWLQVFEIGLSGNMLIEQREREREVVTEIWRKVHNEEFQDLFASLNVNRVIK